MCTYIYTWAHGNACRHLTHTHGEQGEWVRHYVITRFYLFKLLLAILNGAASSVTVSGLLSDLWLERSLWDSLEQNVCVLWPKSRPRWKPNFKMKNKCFMCMISDIVQITAFPDKFILPSHCWIGISQILAFCSK